MSTESSCHITLLPPRLITKVSGSSDTIECSVHSLPKSLQREFHHVFGVSYILSSSPTPSLSSDISLWAIPTNQRARHDLVAIGPEIEAEKDRLLNVFLDFGEEVANKIRSKGYWADYIDPCSGLPMLSLNCNKVYSEVDGMECLLNYKSYNAGFCKILTHPQWGSAVYPATIFAHAPEQIIKEVISSYPDAPLE